MPRFYFNVFNRISTVDDEGADLPDLAAARLEARKGAAGLIAEHIVAGIKINPLHRIDVENDARQIVYRLLFDDLIEKTP